MKRPAEECEHCETVMRMRQQLEAERMAHDAQLSRIIKREHVKNNLSNWHTRIMTVLLALNLLLQILVLVLRW